MKSLHEIIDEHFINSEKDELLLLFNEYGIFEIISKTIELLKIQLQKALTSDSSPVGLVTTTSSNFLVSINQQVVKVHNIEDKLKIQQAVSQIGLRVLLSIVKLFPDDATEIFEEVKQAMQITSEMFDYDYDDIQNRMKFEEFKDLTQTLTGKKCADEINSRTTNSLIWTNKVNLGFLTSELKKRKWIKSQNEFSKLFNKIENHLVVRWDMKYKYHLAYLLNKLKDGDYIRPKKGFFVIAEKYIVDFSGKMITKNSLKKISSKITTEESEYLDIIKEVDGILKAIKNK